MNIAVVSDIHGNLPAMEAVLNDFRRIKPDLSICLGDVATLGPNPREIIRMLGDHKFACIMGNHDAALLNISRMDKLQIAQPLLPALQWSREQLTESDLSYLNSFEKSATFDLPSYQKLIAYHGSPKSITDNILAVTPGTDLARMIKGSEGDILVGGHTHLQMLRKFKGTIVTNPGSVGCPFLKTPDLDESPQLMPWAEYALITCQKTELNIQLRRLSFDISRYRQMILESTNPLKNWLFQQYQRF